MTSGLEAVTDLTPTRWVQAAMPDFARMLCGSIIPGGFEAYARVLHPADPGAAPTSWREVAAASGRRLEPLSAWEDITPMSDRDGGDPLAPDEGRLGAAGLDALVALLAPATTTPDDVWFCLWYGYGDLHEGGSTFVFASTEPNAPLRGGRLRPAIDSATLPTLRLPHREYYVFRGGIDKVHLVGSHISWSGPGQPYGNGPNLWWPDDRAWFVATEIDLVSTYVGGSAELVRAIVASPNLEAFEVAADGPYAR